MCGRISVDDQIQAMVTQQLRIPFTASTNLDLRPTQQVAVVTLAGPELTQMQTTWGIKPAWAKKLLINSQAETVAVKPTFKNAFASRRCVVPCSGFYEWRSEGGAAKQKYYFHHIGNQPLYMAGIWYPGQVPALVTLTTQPAPRMQAYHHRFPVFIASGHVREFLSRPVEQVLPLLSVFDESDISIVESS